MYKQIVAQPYNQILFSNEKKFIQYFLYNNKFDLYNNKDKSHNN